MCNPFANDYSFTIILTKIVQRLCAVRPSVQLPNYVCYDFHVRNNPTYNLVSGGA